MFARAAAVAGVLGAALPGCSPEGPPLPGADAPAFAPDIEAPSPVASATKREPFFHRTGGAFVPVDPAAFEGCDPDAMGVLTGRVTRALDAAAASGATTTPRRPVIEFKGSSFPLDLDGVSQAGVEPTPILLLPSPDDARAAMARAWLSGEPGPTLGELADSVVESAVAVHFAPGGPGPEATVWIPTPLGRPSPLPTVTRRAKPWLRMGRLVVTRERLSPAHGLVSAAQEAIERTGVQADAAVWSIPLNPVVSLAARANGEGVERWVAYSVADGVAGRRVKTGHSLPNGESAYTVPLRSPEHEPRGPRGVSLLRIPATNPRPGDNSMPGPAAFPGERIALDPWFADPVRGFAVVVNTEASKPGAPAFVITTDASVLRGHARDRIEVLAIFGSIRDESLESLAAAYLNRP